MATKLQNPVTRELLGTTMSTKGSKQKIVLCTLEAGDIITFRAKGSTREISVPIAGCINLAELMSGEKDYKEALTLYNLRKKAHVKNLRRPKRRYMPFSKIYYKALENIKINRS